MIMAVQQSGFAWFMASNTGRGLRIVVGLVLIVWGWSMHGQIAGTVLMVVGLVPLAAGVFDVCLLAPLLGAPFSGAKIRAAGTTKSAER